MPKLTLFSGTDCHLCELAKTMLSAELTDDSHLTEINVKTERQYYHQYGARIPVLRNEQSGEELGWPFDESQLKEFLI